MPTTTQYNIRTELTKLRISVARIAQAVNADMSSVQLKRDSGYTDIVFAAERQDSHGWNALCAAILREVRFETIPGEE